MSSGKKCHNCGSSAIEIDPTRGDSVCTNCGSVLEDNFIVSEVQFQENVHGVSNAIGQFVSADSKGGATKFGPSFHIGSGVESREVTLKVARNGISTLCGHLRLNQHCIDTAFGFFKMALARNLTRGRRMSHVHAACVYLTCRTEGTAHLLIDISEVLQICCYELGRTYLKMAKELCINIPSVDPCLYILRFASQLEFGNKTQQVANTALRMVQRMKRDSIHSGRRPSGLCGAALLMAARLHEFNRSPGDIIKIVRVHETTLRKRLMEFGETPSSALTLEEFMTIDLEEEQDPPAFKDARKKDKERIQKILDEPESISELQKSIENQLQKNGNKIVIKNHHNPRREDDETEKFIKESTVSTINEILVGKTIDQDKEERQGLGPDFINMGLANSLDDTSNAVKNQEDLNVDLSFNDINDDELDMYIMDENEQERKSEIWYTMNSDYLEKQRLKEEALQKEREEGKPEKKHKKTGRKKRTVGPMNSAGEAIEKILQEKKVSSKINYDVLKSLTSTGDVVQEEEIGEQPHKRRRLSTSSTASQQTTLHINVGKKSRKKAETGVGLPFDDKIETRALLKALKEDDDDDVNVDKQDSAKVESQEDELEDDYYSDDDDPAPADTGNEELGIMEMLKKHRQEDEDDYGGGGGGGDFNYYDEDDY